MGRTLTSRRALAARLIANHGVTFCDELGIALDQDTAAGWFRWLVASRLLANRIGARAAMRAARALTDAGLNSARAMARASFQDRVGILNAHGYARYDRKTAAMLGTLAERVIAGYAGDLRRLRHEAGGAPDAIRAALLELPGIGPVGCAIFCREAQAAWPELFPFADPRSLAAATAIGLGSRAAELATLVSREDYPRLVSALVRVSLLPAGPRAEASASREARRGTISP